MTRGVCPSLQVDLALREPFEGFNDRASLVAFLARLLCHPLYAVHSAAAAAVKVCNLTLALNP